MLIVTHNINIVRTVPDNIGMLYRKHLVMFGRARSRSPVTSPPSSNSQWSPYRAYRYVRGKDQATAAAEQAAMEAGQSDGGLEEVEGVPPQLKATPGMPERKAVGRRQARVREMLQYAAAEGPGGHPP